MSESLKKRRWCVLNAYLAYHAKALPKHGRENCCWYLLLEWARLGGTKGEVPT